ncbi:helix-turn-helix transcriptional regulator [Shouchella rhizosphaerae]|uniref:YafY family protein n=1 Tax=Shouchella rhizosphaerae TaxID=866786 RepID=A0ABZ2D3D3_9BACI
MRAERLLSIVLLLQNRKIISTKALAEELGVSERTVHRDMDALSSAGIPVYAERGKTGGWKLLDGYRTQLTGLTKEEVKTLFLSPPIDLLGDLGYTKNWQEAREKLLASLSSAASVDFADAQNRIYIDASTWRGKKETVEAFSLLNQGLWEQRALSISYEKYGSAASEREVEPLGLVAKGSTWYLIAAEQQELKTFRASRIRSAQLLPKRFERPENFDLARYWHDSKNAFIRTLPSYEVNLLIAYEQKDMLHNSGRYVRVLDLYESGEDGWLTARLSFDTKEEAAAYIVGFGNKVKMISPTELKKHVWMIAEQALKAHADIG